MNKNKKDERINQTKLNNQGSLMKIIEYKNKRNIVVQFQDEHRYTISTNYSNFKNGALKNPYFPCIYGVGYSGTKYPISINKKASKEYLTWRRMIERCYSENYKDLCYEDAYVCEEWHNYENFYEWIHGQENFEKWINIPLSALDKDILFKNNKIYSPLTCTLVTHDVNTLFCKRDRDRGDCCVGVFYSKRDNKYAAQVNDLNHKRKHLGYYNSEKEAFEAYKKEKEKIIKTVAYNEYLSGNITEKCYQAMIRYEVEITD